MSNPSSDPTIYTVGGTVQVNEWGVYIPRQADGQLLDLCQQGTFAYVLTPRQMGKSSLMIRTAEQLIEAGSLAVIVDLTQIGTQVTADEWYSDFLSLVADQLMLSTDAKAWWQAHSDMGITLRMTRFFKEVVLTEVSEPVAIFVDEIDTTLSLDFTDDFYAAVRFLYVARSTDAALKRLSFVLIGVATPSDLIRDPKRTPFNIGQRVELTDFTADEAAPLGTGLGLEPGLTQQVMGWILAWTQGHPYLTQRLCRALLEQQPESWTEAAVAQGVSNTFFGPMSEQDNNLQFVGDMLTKRAPEDLEREVLDVYRQVHRDRVPVWDEEQSLVKSHLKLAGIVWRDGKQLVVRNPIYREVFNQDWIKDHWPETLWQRLKPAMPLVAGLTAGVLGLGALSVYALDQRNEARTQTDIATQALERAQDAQLEAEAQAAAADDARKEADDERAAAEEAKLDADEQRDIAQQKTQEAEAALADAQAAQAAEAAQRQRAEEGEAEANRQADLAREQTKLAADNAVTTQLALAQVRTQQSLVLGDQLATRADALQQRADQLPQSTLLAIESIRVLEAQDESATEAYEVLNQLRLRPLAQPRPLGQDEKGLRVSNDNRLIATVDAQGTVRVRDIATGTELNRLTVSQLSGITVQDLTFSPVIENNPEVSSRYLLVSGDLSDKVWDLAEQTYFSIGEQNVSSWLFDPTGRYLFVSDDFGSRVWNLAEQTYFLLPVENVSSLVFDPTGRYLATEGDFGSRAWDLAEQTYFSLEEENVSGGNFNADGRYLFVDGDLGGRVWNLAEQTYVPVGEGNISRWLFDPTGRYFFVGGDFGSQVWDLIEQESFSVGEGFIYNWHFDVNGRYLIGPSEDFAGLVWDLAEQTSFSLEEGMSSWEFEGRYFVAIGDFGSLVWDLAEQTSFSLEEENISRWLFDPTSRYLAVSGDFGNRVWNLAEQTYFSLGEEDISTWRFDSTGRYLFVRDESGWRAWNLFEQYSFYLTAQSLSEFRVSPNNQYLATQASANALRVWQITSEQEIAHVIPSQGLESWRFSSNGETLILRNENGIEEVWDLTDFSTVNQAIQEGNQNSIRFSDDHRYILITRNNGVELWDIEANHRTNLLMNNFHEFEFDSTGHYLFVIGHRNKTVLLRMEQKFVA